MSDHHHGPSHRSATIASDSTDGYSMQSVNSRGPGDTHNPALDSLRPEDDTALIDFVAVKIKVHDADDARHPGRVIISGKVSLAKRAGRKGHQWSDVTITQRFQRRVLAVKPESALLDAAAENSGKEVKKNWNGEINIEFGALTFVTPSMTISKGKEVTVNVCSFLGGTMARDDHEVSWKAEECNDMGLTKKLKFYVLADMLPGGTPKELIMELGVRAHMKTKTGKILDVERNYRTIPVTKFHFHPEFHAPDPTHSNPHHKAGHKVKKVLWWIDNHRNEAIQHTVHRLLGEAGAQLESEVEADEESHLEVVNTTLPTE